MLELHYGAINRQQRYREYLRSPRWRLLRWLRKGFRSARVRIACITGASEEHLRHHVITGTRAAFFAELVFDGNTLRIAMWRGMEESHRNSRSVILAAVLLALLVVSPVYSAGPAALSPWSQGVSSSTAALSSRLPHRTAYRGGYRYHRPTVAPTATRACAAVTHRYPADKHAGSTDSNGATWRFQLLGRAVTSVPTLRLTSLNALANSGASFFWRW